MGAVIDINILGDKIVDISKVIPVIEKIFKFKALLKEIEVISNYDFQNPSYISEIGDINDLIDSGNFISMQYTVNEIYNFGLQIEKVDVSKYLTNIWINTVNIEMLGIIDKNDELVCDNISEFLIELIDLFSISIVGVGIESNFELDDDFETIINESENIDLWILRYDNLYEMKNYKLYKSNGEFNMYIMDHR